MLIMIQEGSLILFQGDSVTDCGRSRENDSILGGGYANMVSASLSATYPEKKYRFLNRGISGNRVQDLRGRWADDCIELKPDVVSILIGINDTWRKFDRNDPTSTLKYREDYYYILSQIREKLNAKIILCEPFLLPVHEEQKVLWREDLDPKIHVVRELAREFNAIYVPFDGMFASAACKRELEFWAPDGVHPTQAGHALMSKKWIDTVFVK
jgi:lysophospholipase L1-like esterase